MNQIAQEIQLADATETANGRHEVEVTQARKHLAAKPVDAKAQWKRLRENPLDPQALSALALAYEKEGNHGMAIDFALQAVATDGGQASLHCVVGDLMKKADRFVEAACAYREALQIDGQNVAALNGLGLVHLHRRETGLALACIARALALAPDDLPTNCSMARVLNLERDFTSAGARAKAAIKLDPECPTAHFQLAAALAGLGRFKKAIAVLEQFIEKHPEDTEARCLLVQAFNNLNFHSAVPRLGKHALSLAPRDGNVRFELGTYWLATGDWAKGWQEYEWRFKLNGRQTNPFQCPQPPPSEPWIGQPLENKSLFVHCEQGLGDTIQFARFLPVLAKNNCKLLVHVQPELHGLLQCFSSIARVVPYRGPILPHDYHVPLHSVPRLLNVEVDTLTKKTPYLSPGRSRASEIPLDASAKLRVAFVWSTMPLTNTDHRNAPIAAFASLFDLEEAAFYSVQVNDSAAELDPYLNLPNVRTLKPFIDNLVDTASFLSRMDVVISIDTCVAHLAGALGVEVWVVLPVNGNWRWMKAVKNGPWERRSPWYPTMRLFRCAKFNEWEGVFREVRVELKNRMEIMNDKSLTVGNVAPLEALSRVEG